MKITERSHRREINRIITIAMIFAMATGALTSCKPVTTPVQSSLNEESQITGSSGESSSAMSAAEGSSADPSSQADTQISSRQNSQIPSQQSSQTQAQSQFQTSSQQSSQSSQLQSQSQSQSQSQTSSQQSSQSQSSYSNDQLDEDIAFYSEIVEIETEWLASLQLSNGAMPMTGTKNGVVTANPYFSAFAVLAILKGDDKYLPVVKKYMEWHFDHLNTAQTDYNGVDGTIYDYRITVENGQVKKEEIVINGQGKKQYDSTDSYAAMFLEILWKYYEKSGDDAYIKSNYSDIKRIINALYSTMHDGLTWAKPDYKIKYLMDNVEVWRGMDNIILLYENLLKTSFQDAPAMLTKLKTDRDLVASKIEEQMWNESEKYYECAIGHGGVVAYDFDWDNFYPSATSQLFPITSGMVKPDSARAKLLYANFNKYYSTGESEKTWEEMDIPDSFYWGEMAYCGALMGDEARVKSYMTLYRNVMRNHAWPLYNSDAGRATMAAAHMVEYLSAKK